MKTIQIGCGRIGRTTLRAMIENGFEVVGVVDANEQLHGKDVSELLGLEMAYGVAITGDLDAVLRQHSADVAVITTVSSAEGIFEAAAKCLKSKVNVITSCEDFAYPWDCESGRIKELDAIAKENGVSICGGGTQDVYAAYARGIASVSHRIDTLTVRVFDNTEDYSEEIVGPAIGVGYTLEKFRKTFMEIPDPPKSYLWTSALNTADALGLTIDQVTQTVAPEIAEEDIQSRSLNRILPKGDVAGSNIAVSVKTKEGPEIIFAGITRAFLPGDTRVGQYFWEINGLPNARFAIRDIDTIGHTGSAIVNKIPRLAAARPGVLLYSDLAPVQYIAHKDAKLS